MDRLIVTITTFRLMVLQAGDIVLLDNFTSITNSNFGASDFDDIRFMVTSVPTSDTITITMPSNETGSGATTSGGIRVRHYYPVGPDVQAQGFGWSLGSWGGEEIGSATTTLNGAISSTSGGNNGSATEYNFNRRYTVSIVRNKLCIKIGTEEISYTGIYRKQTYRCNKRG